MNPDALARSRALVATAVALLTLPAAPDSAVASPLPRSAPEAQGVPSGALLGLVEALDAGVDGMHSLMVLRHGQVVAEGWWAPYAAAHNHVLYSLSKSFTSTAVGLAVAEGKLSVDDPVLKFFPDEAPAGPGANLESIRVRDLLTMSTGHQDEPPTSPGAVSAASFLAQPVPHRPGTHFMYNTAATFVQSAIVQAVSGETVLDYLRPRLFEPLGIEFPVWDANSQGVTLGGYGLRVRTEDIAKFGQLYLQKGEWEGARLLPAGWVEAATSKQVANGSNPESDWNQGYGFQFWRCRHNAYRGDGAFGQYCVVMPDQDAVVAITGGVRDMQAVLDILWDELLPACGPEAPAPDPGVHSRLREELGSLQVPPADGAASAGTAATAIGRTFGFPANDQEVESLALATPDGGRTLELVIRQGGIEARYPAGFRRWVKGRAPVSAGRLAGFPDEPVAGTYAWTADGAAVVKVCAYETPFVTTYRIGFAGDEVTLRSETNVAFGPRERPALTGRAE